MFVVNSKSKLDLLNRENWVAIIGSRKASKEELETAYRLAQVCVKKGKIVVSGLAEGVDSYAHRGAIDAGGKTIAILSTSKEESIYPKTNQDLAKRIIENGGLIHPYEKPSPNEWGMKGFNTFQKRLVERDLIVAKMCPVIVSVQDEDTEITGGTKWATSYGIKYGKKVFRIDNNFIFHENPKVENRSIWWIPEFDVSKIV